MNTIFSSHSNELSTTFYAILIDFSCILLYLTYVRHVCIRLRSLFAMSGRRRGFVPGLGCRCAWDVLHPFCLPCICFSADISALRSTFWNQFGQFGLNLHSIWKRLGNFDWIWIRFGRDSTDYCPVICGINFDNFDWINFVLTISRDY